MIKYNTVLINSPSFEKTTEETTSKKKKKPIFTNAKLKEDLPT